MTVTMMTQREFEYALKQVEEKRPKASTTEWLKGKTIKSADVDSLNLTLHFDDNSMFHYRALDGSWSTWDFPKKKLTQ